MAKPKSGPPANINVTRRFEALRELRVEQYWLEKHLQKRSEAALAALNAGATQLRVAAIMGCSPDTLTRHGIYRGSDEELRIVGVRKP